MISIQEIKKQYPNELHLFDRGLLKEYLQYQILSIIFRHKLANKLSFLGGTCIKIVYNSKRFSEDLDFDNKNLSYEEFIELSEFIKRELELLGFKVETKQIRRMAFHCDIKFPQLLFEQGLSAVKSEKILIQFGTFDQKVEYESNVFILSKFDVFDQIIVTPRDVILAQKLWTITQRKKAKGRDFYDIMFLWQNSLPDISFLRSKFGTDDFREIIDLIQRSIKYFNWNDLALDVKPFLYNKLDAQKIKDFPKFLEQKIQRRGFEPL